MENLNNGESYSNGDIRSRIELLPKPQLVDLLCNIASQHPSIAQEIENPTAVHDATLHRKLFVGRLSSSTNSQALRLAFEEYGEIEEAIVVSDRVTGITKNFGFVTYRDIKSVKDALIQPRKYIDGSVAICHLADRRTNDPEFFLGRKLYIGDLPGGVTSENLRSDFQKHGEIEEAIVMTNDRYGFVTFATAEAAKKAIDYNTLHPIFAEGRKRIVKYANPRRGRNPSPEYEQPEDDYVDSHCSVPYDPAPYVTYGVSYPRVYAMTDRFGNHYYYNYSYPYH